MFKTACVVFAGLFLTACSLPGGRPAPASAAGATKAFQQPTGKDVYQLDSAHCEIRLLIYRAGPMARLGHNHVIVNRSVGGWIRYTGDAATDALALDVPVQDFVVDAAQWRTEEGADFAETVSDEAKTGTRANMLSAAVLDGARFPTITLTSARITRHDGRCSATTVISIAGHVSSLDIPFACAVSAGRLAASGSFTLSQTALGLLPFSVMMGALQVKDEVTVKFDLVAQAT